MSRAATRRPVRNTRLRTRVLYLLLGAVVLAHLWREFGPPLQLPERRWSEMRLIGAVKARGGTFQTLGRPPGYFGFGGPEKLAVSFRGTDLSDADLERLRPMMGDHIKILDIGNTRVSDLGLGHLAGLTSLTDLRLGNDDERSHSIPARRTRITDRGLVHLKGLPNLNSLNLCGTEVTDAGLEALKHVRGLITLFLNGTRVRGPGLVHLKTLPRLALVNLDRSAVSDAGLMHLAGARSVQCVSLRGVGLTRAGINHLSTLPRLQEVCLVECGLVVEDLADLIAAKPEIRITR